MAGYRKRDLFDYYRRSLSAAGIEVTNPGAVLCPLCWKETDYDDLSLEYIVPVSVGGRHFILTCTQCNNSHGSILDSHLVQFQAIHDAFKGHGTIPAKLPAHGKEIAANIEWGDGYKNIKIVGRASDPTSVSAMQKGLKAGNIDKLTLRLKLGYIKDRFQKALLRSAYLAVFKCFGYEYANREVVQVIRRRISDTSLNYPRLGSLIGEIRNGKFKCKKSYAIAPGNVNGIDFFLVILQLRKETTTSHFVFMPSLTDNSDEFYEAMERSSMDNNGKTFNIPSEILFA